MPLRSNNGEIQFNPGRIVQLIKRTGDTETVDPSDLERFL